MRESDDLAKTSSDTELSDWKQEDIRFTERMTLSKNPSDKRMINLYKIRRAETTRKIEACKTENMKEVEPEHQSMSILPSQLLEEPSEVTPSSMFTMEMTR